MYAYMCIYIYIYMHFIYVCTCIYDYISEIDHKGSSFVIRHVSASQQSSPTPSKGPHDVAPI